MTSKFLFWCAIAALAIGIIGSMVPWKSRRLSPASVQRRFYWTGSVAAVVLLFLAALPDLRSGIIVSFVAALILAGSAFFRSSDIKIGHRIWAAYHFLRRPDPPARAPSDET